MIDIRKRQDVLDIINTILNNGGIAEVKNESRKAGENIVVVEIKRTVKTKKENN